MSSSQQTPVVALSDEAKAKLSALIDAYPSDKHPGTVAGVVNAKGDVQFLKATGVKDLASGEKYDTDTVFWVASCTKLVTSIAALQQVEAGKVKLDEPLGKIVPELDDPDLITSSTESEVKVSKAKTKVTLRQLLTHTAGFAYPFFNKDIQNWVKLNNANPLAPMKAPLANEPGTKFEYGTNIDWAGVVVERLSGQKLGDYFKEHIFDPIGMTDSTFDLSSRADLAKRLATLHFNSPDGFIKIDFPIDFNGPDFHSGGAGMLTTAPDYLKLVATILNRGVSPLGKTILKPATWQEEFKLQTADLADLGALADNGAITTQDPAASVDLGLLPGARKGWGLSHLTNVDDLPNGRKAGAAEWYGIANLFWTADPALGIGAVVFNEVLPLGLPAFFGTITTLQEIIFSPDSLVKA